MNDYEGIDERIVMNVKTFAKKLSIKNRNADLEDIEQELMLHVIKGMRNFDPMCLRQNVFSKIINGD